MTSAPRWGGVSQLRTYGAARGFASRNLLLPGWGSEKGLAKQMLCRCDALTETFVGLVDPVSPRV